MAWIVRSLMALGVVTVIMVGVWLGSDCSGHAVPEAGEAGEKQEQAAQSRARPAE